MADGAPYSFTAYKPIDITVDGEHVVLATGDRREFGDACATVRFLNALTTQTGGSFADNTAGGIEQMQAACVASGGTADGVSAPTTPAPVPDPGTTDPAAGNPQAAGDHSSETPQSLGAPQPALSGGADSSPRDPGGSDGRALGQQYHDPRDPMADYDVAQLLQSMGVSGSDLGPALQSVQHNDPTPGQPHDWFGRDDGFPLQTVADPVLAFTGQYCLVATDLSVASEPVALHFTRTYTSGEVSFGPLGYNWDHNYNCYLRPLKTGGAAIWTGARTEDVYAPRPAPGPAGEIVFEPPTGVYRWLTHDPGGVLVPETYRLIDREGLSQIFARPDGWPLGDRLPLLRIEDRHGVGQDLLYDPEGRLERVRDGAGRFLRFGYGDCGLLEWVEDHTARRWTYRHAAEIEHLAEVVTPPLPDWPQGMTTRYRYDDWRSHPALLHNLISVIDPAGRQVVSNTYGDDPMTPDFARVVRQEYGPWLATFTAEQLQYVPRTPDALDIPAWRVSVVDPGILKIYTFNFRGDLLDERFRLVNDGSYRLVVRTYRYDAQGNLAERREPNGLGMAYVHDDANPDPRARGNLLRAELLAPPTRPAPSRIVRTMTYEPGFHRLKTMRDEKGRLTTWEFDYESAPGGVGDVVAIRHPDATLPDGTIQQRRETFEYDARGRLAAHVTGAGHRHEFDYAAAGPSDGFLVRATWDVGGAAEQVAIEHDAAGRRSAAIDGLGNRTETDRDALDRITAIRRPGPAGEAIRFGYSVDGQVSRHERPKGSFDDGGTTDATLIDLHEYDPWGHRTASVHGANTAQPRRYGYAYDGEGRLVAATDPLGTQTRMTYDERGCLLTSTEAFGAPEEATTRYGYDLNGNQVRMTDAAGHRIDYDYDAWDHPVRTRLPGAPDAERTVVSLTVDERDRCTAIKIDVLVSPGVVGPLFAANIDYDERGRPWRRRVADTVSTITYDADERAVRAEDQRGGVLTLHWDGLDRAIEASDPGGNIERRRYDAAGALVEITSREKLSSGWQDFVTTIAYDARRRPTKIVTPLGHATLYDYDARDLAITATDPLGRRSDRAFGLFGEIVSIVAEAAPGVPVETAMRFDAAGRLVEQRDGEGGATTLAYDRRDRRTAITYPDGRTHRFVYGLRRQLESETLPGGTIRRYTYAADAGLSAINIVAAGGVAATADTHFVSDGLRRVVRAEQDGHVVERRYDPSLRLVEEVVDGRASGWRYDDIAGAARLHYPDGRVDRVDLDLLRRPAALTLETAGGEGLTGAVPVGTQLSRWAYAGAGRLVARKAFNGVDTQLDYDDAGRVTAITHSDGGGTDLAAMRVAYDSGDRRRVAWMGPLPQAPRRIDFDGLSRVVAVADDLALAPPLSNADQTQADAAIATAQAAGGATEAYDLNRADARIGQHRLIVPTADEIYALDPAARIASVTRTGAGAGVTPYTFDADGRCVQDGRYRYTYDGLDRLVEIRDLGGAILLRQTFDPVGRPLLRTSTAGVRRLDYHGMRLVGWRDGAPGSAAGQLSYGLGGDDVAAAATGTLAVPLFDLGVNLLAWTDATGAVSERYRYDLFGDATIFAPDGVTPRGAATIEPGPAFGGHRLLVPGRYDARARIYDPGTGRFLTPDPLGYPDAGNLYVYARHDPADWIDPTGEIGILLGLAVAAGIGLVAGLGTNAVRQGLQIHEGSRESFSWGEFAFSGAIGAVAAPVLVLVPELALPLAAYGVAGGVGEISQGHYESGAFDIATSLLPFLSKGTRGATMGRGSVFSPARGLGPIATGAERFGRFGELGRATQDLAGRMWNERFYHGTTYYAALETVEQAAIDVARVRDAHLTNPSPPEHGPGLYFGRQPGGSGVQGSPQYWADMHGGQGRGGGGAVLEASISRWRGFLLRRQPGVLIDSPQARTPINPASVESVFPLGGGRGGPVSGPGVEFNAAARYRLWDPEAIAPSLDALWPALSSPVPWLRSPRSGGQTAAPRTAK